MHPLVFQVNIVAIDLAVDLLKDLLAFGLTPLSAVPPGRLWQKGPSNGSYTAECELRQNRVTPIPGLVLGDNIERDGGEKLADGVLPG